ncbi:23S rRNA (uracil(1939)-C(5))-methyltransferase RlmD [Clostridium fermenticellae]|uniref:23S rRNA (Uracil(1939)-C(5))-methyltransferase RlmD n=1 Tax=Clostridium fermenticellae TaxID=2068654 RepID=A0A386H5N4_9CLOT|nr:23S rRNA (uracil(1939)-C(5))-methyltransferase RlmD [Clostridium fermenticellae]AYD40924.1 23S rRNA (uracil(1939)-C(5))-methyltransferase RlmD [Clostridium fermenticellae]
MKKGQTYDFFIEDMEFPGTGIAFLDGIKTYIKNAVTGQSAKARVIKKKKDYAQAKLVEVIQNVDYAIDPVCEHFDLCGGCTTEFIPYEKQLELKEKQVLKLFYDADIHDFGFLGIEKSPEEYEYRNKMEFSFGDEVKGGELTLGMHIKGRSFGIVNVSKCQLVDSDFRKILTSVVEYFREKGLPYYRVMKREGYLRNLVIRKAKNTSEILINLVTTSEFNFDLEEFKEMLLKIDYDGNVKGILHTINDGFSDTVRADSVDILYGRDYIIEEILGLKFKISPESFFQTNSKGAERLYSIVKEFLGDVSSKVVFDLYCGTGTIGQIVAEKANKVFGIEIVEEAIKAANENAKLNGLNNCKFIAGDVAKVIKTVQEKPDVIILDPPRPGVHPTALQYVIKFDVPSIIYVSCNPKTLVIDLKVLMDAGYCTRKVMLMDMFPQTHHVETIVKLSRK